MDREQKTHEDLESESIVTSTIGYIKESIPTILSNVFVALLNIINLHFAGKIGSGEILAAASISIVWYNFMSFSPMISMNNAFIALASQAYGTRSYKKLGGYYQKALAINFSIATFSFFTLFFGPEILMFFGIDPVVAEYARTYLRIQILSGFTAGFFETTRNYLISQNNFSLFVYVSVFAVFIHIFICSIVFKYGLFAIALSKLFIEGMLCIFLRTLIAKYKICSEAWRAWNWEDLKGMKDYLIIAIPSGSMVYMDWLAVEIMTVFAGQISNSAMAACGSFLSMNAFIFLLSFGISVTLGTYIGNEMGRNEPKKAIVLIKRGVYSILAMFILIEIIILYFYETLVIFFTEDPKVISDFTEIKFAMQFFIVFDGLQGYFSNVMRALNLQNRCVKAFIISYYCIGIPLCLTLAFVVKLGLFGLMMGLSFAPMSFCFYTAYSLYTLDFKETAKLIHERSKDDEAGTELLLH